MHLEGSLCLFMPVCGLKIVNLFLQAIYLSGQLPLPLCALLLLSKCIVVSFACQLQVTYQLSQTRYLFLQPHFSCPLSLALSLFYVDLISSALAEKLLLYLVDAAFDSGDVCLEEIEGGCEGVELRLHLDLDGIPNLLYTLGVLLPDFQDACPLLFLRTTLSLL